jgi:hypothetical protein
MVLSISAFSASAVKSAMRFMQVESFFGDAVVIAGPYPYSPARIGGVIGYCTNLLE